MERAPRVAPARWQFGSLVPAAPDVAAHEMALVVIDMTNYNAHPAHGFSRILREAGADLTSYEERVERLAVPNAVRLVAAYRDAGARIVYTRSGAQFGDFADTLVHLRDLQRRAETVRGTREFDLREEFEPRVGEAVVDKPGSCAFTTGNLDQLLRNAGVRRVAFCGVVSNGCVLLSALTAWDLGYAVTVVDDASAAIYEEMHVAALAVARWMGIEIADTDDVVGQVEAAAARGMVG